jgi:hypothetical protein
MRQVVRGVDATTRSFINDDDARARLFTSGRMWVLRMIVRSPASPRTSSRVSVICFDRGRGRLVENQHLGIVEDSLGETDALPVALRELCTVPVRHVIDVRLFHHVGDARFALGPAQRPDFDARGEVEVIAHGHVGVERRRFRQVAGALLRFDRMGEDVEARDDDFAVGRGM